MWAKIREAFFKKTFFVINPRLLVLTIYTRNIYLQEIHTPIRYLYKLGHILNFIYDHTFL